MVKAGAPKLTENPSGAASWNLSDDERGQI